MTNEYLFIIGGKRQTVVAKTQHEAIKRISACTRRKSYSKTITFEYIGEVDKAPPNLPIDVIKYVPLALRNNGN